MIQRAPTRHQERRANRWRACSEVERGGWARSPAPSFGVRRGMTQVMSALPLHEQCGLKKVGGPTKRTKAGRRGRYYQNLQTKKRGNENSGNPKWRAGSFVCAPLADRRKERDTAHWPAGWGWAGASQGRGADRQSEAAEGYGGGGGSGSEGDRPEVTGGLRGTAAAGPAEWRGHGSVRRSAPPSTKCSVLSTASVISSLFLEAASHQPPWTGGGLGQGADGGGGDGGAGGARVLEILQQRPVQLRPVVDGEGPWGGGLVGRPRRPGPSRSGMGGLHVTRCYRNSKDGNQMKVV